MTKGEIIYRTSMAIVFAVGFVWNVDAEIQSGDWLPFIRGVSVMCCALAVITHVVALAKGKVKHDEEKDVSHV